MANIRKATNKDIQRIMEIISSAKEFLKEQGLPQWQDGNGPDEPAIAADIAKGEGYLLENNGCVAGYAALVGGIEESYKNIAGGAWEDKYGSYLTIHRVALDPIVRGQKLSAFLMSGLIEEAKQLGYHDIRIDTHPGNKIMQKVILNAGFVYIGMIELPFVNGERQAYQLIFD